MQAATTSGSAFNAPRTSSASLSFLNWIAAVLLVPRTSARTCNFSVSAPRNVISSYVTKAAQAASSAAIVVPSTMTVSFRLIGSFRKNGSDAFMFGQLLCETQQSGADLQARPLG